MDSIKVRSFNLNKSQRMQQKAIICVIGVIVLLILAIWGVNKKLVPKEEHIPQVRQLDNVWITEVTEKGLRFFDGLYQEYSWENIENPLVDSSAREQIADITLTDDMITQVVVKNQGKISGKVLSVNAQTGVELEGKGVIPFSADMKIYKLYEELRLAKEGEISVGYNFCDYVLEDGKICAVLITRQEAMEYIRVQIKASNYTASYHANVEFTVDSEFVIRYGIGENVTEELHKAGDKIEINGDSPYFLADRIYIIPAVLTSKITLFSVERSQGTPSYRGTMEILRKEESGNENLYIINELLLEEYLYAVVPSEMPSSYPLEALKAQAVSARTYAYGHMKNPSNKTIGAHVDDSAGYQVYNNILEQDTTTEAVKATNGELLYANAGLVSTFYYSTSCGFGSDTDIWKGDSSENYDYLVAKSIGTGESPDFTSQTLMEEDTFEEYISQKFSEDFEVEEGWYRWDYNVKELDKDRMATVLESRRKANAKLVLTLNKQGEYESKEIDKLGDILDIYIEKRNDGGVADELIIETKNATYKVISEHNIRYVLCDGVTKVIRQDGSKIDMTSLLPSGFFTIATSKEDKNVVGYSLTGGGFGHGVGMSQNGAKSMAKYGYTYQDILSFFYENSYIEQIY